MTRPSFMLRFSGTIARLVRVLAIVASPAALPLPAAATGVLPDLVIEDARIEPSNPSLMRVKVANLGMLAAAETELSLSIRRGDEIRTTAVVVPLLKSGDRQWLSIALGMRPVRTDEVVLRIDDPPRLEESDEANNAFVYR